MTTTVNTTIRDLRIATLRTIAELCEHHVSLTPPSMVDMFDHSRESGRYFALEIKLPESDRAGLADWAALLDLEMATPRSRERVRWVSASRTAYGDETVWLGWHRVEVVTFLRDAR